MVNIFGGIMRCDIIAEGIIAAAQELNLSVPIICRLQVYFISLLSITVVNNLHCVSKVMILHENVFDLLCTRVTEIT